MDNHQVLVLNQDYQPLNVCHVRRAVLLVYQSKAEMLENGSGFWHSEKDLFALPSVIRLSCLIKHPPLRPKLNRAEIFSRDKHTCQYCGRKDLELTIDHVNPKHQGGPHVWENVVTACLHCNRLKAGRTPEQAHMKLLSIPGVPQYRYGYSLPRSNGSIRHEWRPYLGIENEPKLAVE